MLYFGKAGRQCLDLSNELILTVDKNLVTCKSKKWGPKEVHNASFISVGSLSFWKKIKACFIVFKFIWTAKRVLR